jgi:hypothetical protein
MQRAIDEIFWLASRKIEAGASQTVAGRWRWQRDLKREHASSFTKSGPSRGRLDAGGDYIGESSFIVNLQANVRYIECLENLFCLSAD